MPPIVRPATPADLAHLCRWNASMARETEGRELDMAVLERGVRAVFAQPQRGFYRVAEIDGVPCGGLLVTCEWSDWNDSDYWWIQSVYVEPAARRLGVFRALHAEVLRDARAAGVTSVRLYVEQTNQRAQATYAGLGMRPSHYAMYEQAP